MTGAPHPFTLRQLQYIVAVADALSFRQAAARCHVSQPALSTQVAQVEDLLGAVLFERDRRQVRVTNAGAELVERARALLRGADDLVMAARRTADPLRGTLRLGVIPTISPYLLPALTLAQREQFPDLVTLWTEAQTDALVDQLHTGQLDAALLALEPNWDRLEYAELGEDPFVFACSHSHPLAKKTSRIQATVLDDSSLLLLDDGHCFRDQTLRFCAQSGAQEMAFRATSLSTLTQMVAQGAGATLLPALAVATECERADLVIRRFQAPVPSRTLVLAWRSRSTLHAAYQAFAEVAATTFHALLDHQRDGS